MSIITLKGNLMGNQNQDQNRDQSRQTQGGAGQRTTPHDPKLNPEQDDDNLVEQRTSDEGQGRDQSASGKRSSAGGTDQGQTGTNRGGNP
jgi:hypothetical protein